ncbi:hypothetical protein CCHR01_10718 [Colletotrichum chrysophilum]|uniref:Uncharacterized protein n=1 Tax=Colletotrichum chrysophilum TaxID=1836956 RepID=A0AAD9AG36_9PEZI|nr:hypothetical protein CCHR01_10718 [Colletotrichum chrysophilum]
MMAWEGRLLLEWTTATYFCHRYMVLFCVVSTWMRVLTRLVEGVKRYSLQSLVVGEKTGRKRRVRDTRGQFKASCSCEDMIGRM